MTVHLHHHSFLDRTSDNEECIVLLLPLAAACWQANEMDPSLASLPESIRETLKKLVGSDPCRVDEAKSAQQRVLVLQYDYETVERFSSPWAPMLIAGGKCLVVRIWKGGSRWWNLNQAKHVRTLAAAEVAGYRLAHEALGTKVPKVLYAVVDGKDDDSPLWAVLEYVGRNSSRFDDRVKVYDQAWTESMIKVRDEFGFPEPHPRWGRVPVDSALSYALRVLDQVTLPLHRHLYYAEQKGTVPGKEDVAALCSDLLECEQGYTYTRMVQHYRKALGEMEAVLAPTSLETKDKPLSASLKALGQCVLELEKETVKPLPLVLVHMDCQPQNLVFARTPDRDPWCISSMLDWEDCAFGDPRFELLLLGRKVSLEHERGTAVTLNVSSHILINTSPGVRQSAASRRVVGILPTSVS
jgi:hypothetical protein